MSYYASGYEVSKTGEPSGTLVPVTVNSLQKFSNGKTLKDDFERIIRMILRSRCVKRLWKETMRSRFRYLFRSWMPSLLAPEKQNVYLRLDYSTLKRPQMQMQISPRLRRIRQIIYHQRNRLHRPSQLQLRTARTWFPKNTVTRHSPLRAKAKTCLTYKSSNTKIAAVDSKGKVTIKAAGTVKITISAKQATSYKAATKTHYPQGCESNTSSKDKDFTKDTFLQCAEKESTGVPLGTSRDQQREKQPMQNSRKLCISVNKTNGKITVKKGLEERYLQDQK